MPPNEPSPDAIPVPRYPEIPPVPPDFPETTKPQPPKSPFPAHPEETPGQEPEESAEMPPADMEEERDIVEGYQRNVGTDMVLGAVAGTVATLAMGRASTAIYNRQSRLVRWQEDLAGGGAVAHANAARKAAGLLAIDLDRGQAEAVGEAMHFGVGASLGALYGAARPHIPASAPIRGLAFGAAAWLLGDEIGNVAVGITPGPGAFPWQTHARGLAAHLTFGLVTEAILSAVDWIRGPRNAVAPPPVRERVVSMTA